MEPDLGIVHEIEEELEQGSEGDEIQYDYVPPIEQDVVSTLQSDLIKFTLAQLQTYTNGFIEANLLGHGSFGNVYKGVIRGRDEIDLEGAAIAVKVSQGVFQADRQQWENEIRYLPRFSHQNVIQLIGIAETTKRLFLIYPLMEKGNVSRNLGELNWSNTYQIIKGTATALRELQNSHVPPLIFRDLKLANILLDTDFNPKLADWGTVTLEGEYSSRFTGGYMLPDERHEPGHTKLDIYSLGVCILQLLMKSTEVRRPFDPNPRYPNGSIIAYWARDEYSKYGHIVHKDLKRSGCKGAIAKAISKLALDCVKENRDERPSVSEILEALSELEPIQMSFIKNLAKKFTLSCMKN